MRKKIQATALIAVVSILLCICAASPVFVPVDPDQPVRPLLMEDQALKETYLAVLQDPDLKSESRSLELTRLSQSYRTLAQQTKDLQTQGIDHPVLEPLEVYFSDLSNALTVMATAFENTDPILLGEANDSLKALDVQFQTLKK